MSGAARETDLSDIDLETIINMLDTALTSRDERVVNALRSLLMITTLTQVHGPGKLDNNDGPLRRLRQDMRDLLNRLSRLEETMRNQQNNLHGTTTTTTTVPYTTTLGYTYPGYAGLAQPITTPSTVAPSTVAPSTTASATGIKLKGV